MDNRCSYDRRSELPCREYGWNDLSQVILMDEAKTEAIAMVKETRRIALRLHTMGVPYQDEAASLYEIAEYIERVMDVKP